MSAALELNTAKWSDSLYEVPPPPTPVLSWNELAAGSVQAVGPPSGLFPPLEVALDVPPAPVPPIRTSGPASARAPPADVPPVEAPAAPSTRTSAPASGREVTLVPVEPPPLPPPAETAVVEPPATEDVPPLWVTLLFDEAPPEALMLPEALVVPPMTDPSGFALPVPWLPELEQAAQTSSPKIERRGMAFLMRVTPCR